MAGVFCSPTIMAFKLRLEFPGATYHTLNRGNYRRWMFADASTKTAFEVCLFETCERCGWLLHSFVVMSNHYHLALETPHGNLITGMQWLQATFANRFNRLRNERGHLFQGRYKALPVERGDALGLVCHYAHLNPVRAGLLPIAELADYRWSSYWYLRRPTRRPHFLRVETALQAAGGLPDSHVGWDSYADFLRWQAAEGPAGKNEAYVQMSRGWAIGSDQFKHGLLQDRVVASTARTWAKGGAAEVRTIRWQMALEAAMAQLSIKGPLTGHKSAPWKVAVAIHLKQTTDGSNRWLAQQLAMGSAAYVSKLVGQSRRQPTPAVTQWLQRLAMVKGKA